MEVEMSRASKQYETTVGDVTDEVLAKFDAAQEVAALEAALGGGGGGGALVPGATAPGALSDAGGRDGAVADSDDDGSPRVRPNARQHAPRGLP